MQSIAGQKIEIKLPFVDKNDVVIFEETFTIEEISVYDELEIDCYFNEIVEKEKTILKANEKRPLNSFLLNDVFGKQRFIEFAELGKKIVKELADKPLLETGVTFYYIIAQLQSYRLDLKKK